MCAVIFGKGMVIGLDTAAPIHPDGRPIRGYGLKRRKTIGVVSMLKTTTSALRVAPEASGPLYIDVETRSAAKLGKGKEAVGVRAYSEHHSTEVLCVAYARSDGDVEL
jgi:hypothetical protein